MMKYVNLPVIRRVNFVVKEVNTVPHKLESDTLTHSLLFVQNVFSDSLGLIQDLELLFQ